VKVVLNYISLAWLLLIALKALEHLSWGWVSVLFFPLWFPIALVLACMAIGVALLIAFVVLLIILSLFVKD